jgi:hypothetical protein
MVLGVEGVKPPAWGQRPHSPCFQLMMSTYLALSYNGSHCGQDGVQGWNPWLGAARRTLP